MKRSVFLWKEIRGLSAELRYRVPRVESQENNTQNSKGVVDIETTTMISNNKRKRKSTTVVNGYPGQVDPG